MTFHLVLGVWDVVALVGIAIVSNLLAQGGVALLRSRLESRNYRLVKVRLDREGDDTLSEISQHSSVRPARGSLPPTYTTHPRVIGLENFDRNAKSTWRPPRIPRVQN